MARSIPAVQPEIHDSRIIFHPFLPPHNGGTGLTAMLRRQAQSPRLVPLNLILRVLYIEEIKAKDREVILPLICDDSGSPMWLLGRQKTPSYGEQFTMRWRRPTSIAATHGSTNNGDPPTAEYWGQRTGTDEAASSLSPNCVRGRAVPVFGSHGLGKRRPCLYPGVRENRAAWTSPSIRADPVPAASFSRG
jgi:hypothetical protein